MAIQVEDRRGVEQDGSQPDSKLNGRLNVGTKHSVDDVSAKSQQRKDHSSRTNGSVVPTELRRSAHQARGNEDAECHRDQKQLAEKERNRGGGEGVETVVQGVCRPGQLPCAEVRLTALLVQICKDEEQQDGYEAWDNRGGDDDTIHRVGGFLLARVAGSLSGGTVAPMLSYQGRETQ